MANPFGTLQLVSVSLSVNLGTCGFPLSIVLLIASAIYELTKISYIDIIGSLALAYLSFKEGRECFEKAKSDQPYSCDSD